ncbi:MULTISPECIES: carbamoyltransferase C-terminal domain-containing protein [unclassified Paenibacillus]|uniref:carbamoyltransferase C-terminal domain-containing protein n=1 Tax=unclassified Paenibacillus TaxID=185978 RepID=UPI001E4E5F8B|nr:MULTISPECIES: carbamoyltransferase C-terminal domain-containing protein [unclassified Paenibacillus]
MWRGESMQDGYYLSTYFHIGPLDYLTGTCIRHDPNMALFRKEGGDIRLIRYWELERFTGRKQHRQSFYSLEHAAGVVDELLGPLGLSLEDMTEVWGTPGLATCSDYHSLDDYPDLSYHSISHLFSAVMADSRLFYEGNVLGLAVDGIPDDVVDRETGNKPFFAGCLVRSGKLELFPVQSPGPLWDWSSTYYNLREGTLMALAYASESAVNPVPLELPPAYDRNFNIWEHDYLRPLIEAADKLCERDARENPAYTGFDPRFTERENKISAVMKQVQAASIALMERNVEAILDSYGVKPEETYLALAGGYALNCPTNSHLMRKYGFKGMIAPPCVNDSGLSLGMGLYAFYRKMSPARIRFRLGHAYHGASGSALEEVLQSGAFAGCIGSVTPLEESRAAEDLCHAPVVWFDGPAEMGPRALGARSLLGDPRTSAAKDALNTVKQREWWRPVAPVILAGEVGEWFEEGCPSPYMLHTFRVKAEKRELIPAVIHLDGTARVQTVEDAPPTRNLYRLLRAFKEATGVPVLCNTSLNGKGEPIIQDIGEALHFALVKGIEVAYINGRRVQLVNHGSYRARAGNAAFPRQIEFSPMSPEERDAAMLRHNPHRIPLEILKFYMERIERGGIKRYDLTDPKQARRLIREVQLHRSRPGEREFCDPEA